MGQQMILQILVFITNLFKKVSYKIVFLQIWIHQRIVETKLMLTMLNNTFMLDGLTPELHTKH